MAINHRSETCHLVSPAAVFSFIVSRPSLSSDLLENKVLLIGYQKKANKAKITEPKRPNITPKVPAPKPGPI